MAEAPHRRVGHSAAFRTLLGWLDEPQIDTVVLVDAAYGEIDQYKAWVLGSDKHRLIDIGDDTREWTDKLHAALPDKRRARLVPVARGRHPARRRQRARILDIKSTLGHFPLVTGGIALPMILRTLRARRLVRVPLAEIPGVALVAHSSSTRSSSSRRRRAPRIAAIARPGSPPSRAPDRRHRSAAAAMSEGRDLLPNQMPRGGKRPGAGRKKTGKLVGGPHRTRPLLDARHPVHVVLRAKRRLSWRQARTYAVLRKVLAFFLGNPRFRICHISIQRRHLHLIVEAADREALTLGIQSFSIRAARAINRDRRTRGKVFAAPLPLHHHLAARARRATSSHTC